MVFGPISERLVANTCQAQGNAHMHTPLVVVTNYGCVARLDGYQRTRAAIYRARVQHLGFEMISVQERCGVCAGMTRDGEDDDDT